MKKRNDIVDIARLIFALCLMYHHTYVFILYDGEYPFCNGSRYFVEAFLIWTGYFTYNHFASGSIGNYSAEGFRYWLAKFASYLPYTIPAVLFQYILDSSKYWEGGLRSTVASFYEMPFEMMFLRETYTAAARVVPLWFLSAMFLVFPIVLLLIGIRNKYAIAMISFLYPVFYYGKTGVSGIRDWPNDLLRALAGLCIGIMIAAIFDISHEQSGQSDAEKELGQKQKLLLTCLLIITFVYPIICSFFNWTGTDKLSLLSITVAIAIMLKGDSYLTTVMIPFASYLGRLSLPLYIWQWGVASLINLTMNSGEKNSLMVGGKILIYFVGSFAVSIASMSIVDAVKRKKKS